MSKFEKFVMPEPNTGCFIWIASRGTAGYGQAASGRRGRVVGAHRRSWELAHGPIPEGMQVLHKCDFKLCVNPAHLFLGTQAVNLADMRAKKRDPRGEGHGRSKLTADQVAEIRQLALVGLSYKEIGRRFGVAGTAISEACRGKTWTHVHVEHIRPDMQKKRGLPKGVAPWWKPWYGKARTA